MINEGELKKQVQRHKFIPIDKSGENEKLIYADMVEKYIDDAKKDFQSCIIGFTNVTRYDVVFVEQTWQIDEKRFKDLFLKWFGDP
jgi:hypothetical protein